MTTLKSSSYRIRVTRMSIEKKRNFYLEVERVNSLNEVRGEILPSQDLYQLTRPGSVRLTVAYKSGRIISG